MARLNKKVLVFIDESGTPGQPDFMLGAVAVAARDVPVSESLLASLRPANAGELHASAMGGEAARDLLNRFRGAAGDRGLTLINKASAHHPGTREQIYAAAVIETVKTAIHRYARQHRIQKIGNVELILDRNDINAGEVCRTLLAEAQQQDGVFRAVAHIAAVDSSAVRFLQLADLVAYARRWRDSGDIDGARLERECGIALF